MWVDVIEKEKIKTVPLVMLSPPPRYEFELRVIVWSTKDCEYKDEIEKCNDVFVRGVLATTYHKRPTYTGGVEDWVRLTGE